MGKICRDGASVVAGFACLFTALWLRQYLFHLQTWTCLTHYQLAHVHRGSVWLTIERDSELSISISNEKSANNSMHTALPVSIVILGPLLLSHKPSLRFGCRSHHYYLSYRVE